VQVTAILEAGRVSLDNNGRRVKIIYNKENPTIPQKLIIDN